MMIAAENYIRTEAGPFSNELYNNGAEFYLSFFCTTIGRKRALSIAIFEGHHLIV